METQTINQLELSRIDEATNILKTFDLYQSDIQYQSAKDYMEYFMND